MYKKHSPKQETNKKFKLVFRLKVPSGFKNIFFFPCTFIYILLWIAIQSFLLQQKHTERAKQACLLSLQRAPICFERRSALSSRGCTRLLSPLSHAGPDRCKTRRGWQAEVAPSRRGSVNTFDSEVLEEIILDLRFFACR